MAKDSKQNKQVRELTDEELKQVNGGDKKGIGNISFNDFLSMRPELIKDEKAGDSD